MFAWLLRVDTDIGAACLKTLQLGLESRIAISLLEQLFKVDLTLTKVPLVRLVARLGDAELLIVVV